jgi:L-ascorbate metabolism protein UlaG (beta-lactamase superfamily)
VTDPHDGSSIGIPAPSVKADIILISHDHYDHNSVRSVEKEDSSVIKFEEGKKTVLGIPIEGITSYHDDAQGAKRGKNIIYKFTMDGVTFCHLGDLGCIPGKETLEKIGEVDVLFIPVGGTFTLDANEAWKLIELIKPRIIVPMHYKIGGLSLPISGIDPFLEKNTYKILHVGNEIDIEKEELPEETEIWVFTL